MRTPTDPIEEQPPVAIETLSPDLIQSLITDAIAFDRLMGVTVANDIPALAQVPGDLFGIGIVGVNGIVYTAGDWVPLHSPRRGWQ